MARAAKKKTELTPEEKMAQALVPEADKPYQVPENWLWLYGKSFLCPMETKRPTGNYFNYIDIDSIDNKRQTVTAPKHIEVSQAPSRASRALHSGDTVFSMVRPYLKNIAFIDESIADSIASTGFYVCKPKENVAPKYLYYLMVSSYVVDGLNAYMKGDNSPSIRKEELEQFPYPIPPLAEQQRIVDRIENLFAKLDEAKEKAQAVVDGAKERKTSLLFQAFTGKLTEKWRTANDGHYSVNDWVEFENSVVDPSECPTELPDSWKWIRMGAIGYTNIGLTYSPSDKADDGIIVLRSSNIQNGKMDYADIVRVNMSIPENKMCKKGDLLICARNGSKALVGKTAIVDADGMSYGAFMAIFRSIYNPYIYFFLSSPFFRDLIDKDVGTTTINQVTQAIIKKLPLPFAPAEEQKEVVRILSELLRKEDSVIEAAMGAIDQIDAMKKSILARAFRGELGTNDPADESAEELLKRIL